ncbi:MAG: isoprenylcysteine carboxylmethyltransferase family protein [Ignavibacteriaceae bacterium]|nr:isoprenylcysteine carboxylmethyltransferase family protein [Ignavibacterium sp.]MCC6255096.1 isoprenylcysteine carboxylmethyltransferase family protein [Ignavibacteriaceae bacterium]HMN23191.1 isoprenylcysteine carboxylmethyltransferase family protein [Ignavibacteriaceae bacterium]HRN27356.1 isoprenylcysteine carboxylmethyltransferase family protein [Ignavibacteriaceae bacterium]HRP92995.1 isoprenylcysteine carboxylmethyltransferase family protein [Ignavibacteriaceae bacterium]
MDPINIIIGLNIIATFGANIGAAKKGIKDKVGVFKDKPKTYLQTLPMFFSTLTLVVLIVSIFQIGTLEYKTENQTIRIIGLAFYLIFSWVQIWATKVLGDNYSQDIAIKKNHQLVTAGPFKIVRHPQYLSQFLMDIGAAFATLSFILAPLAVILLPFLFMRASLEDKLLEKHFGENFRNFKKKTGMLIPFIG